MQNCSLSPTAVQSKPEPDSAVNILHTTLFLVGIHNSLYDGKADSAASVGPRPCLIHFIKFRPEIWQILFRDMVSGVKYRNADFPAVLLQCNHDPAFSVSMINGIVQIIRHDLFNLELICQT